MQPRQDWKKNNKKRKQNNSNNNDERPEQVNIKQCFKYINIYTLDTTPFNIFHIYMRQYTKERQPNNPLFCFHIASFSPNSKRFAALNLLFFWLLLWWRLVVFIVLRKNYEFDFELYYYSPICGIIFTASDSVIWLALHWACVFFLYVFCCYCHLVSLFLHFRMFSFILYLRISISSLHTHTHTLENELQFIELNNIGFTFRTQFIQYLSIFFQTVVFHSPCGFDLKIFHILLITCMLFCSKQRQVSSWKSAFRSEIHWHTRNYSYKNEQTGFLNSKPKLWFLNFDIFFKNILLCYIFRIDWTLIQKHPIFLEFNSSYFYIS